MDACQFVDPIHGTIQLTGLANNIVHSVEFQRLRNLKQLGVSFCRFPSATHTRFEHSLGVYFLARKFMAILEENGSPPISELRRNCVSLAGLLHDIGHGPFSHMWEVFVHLGEDTSWSHEHTSCAIVQQMFEKYDLQLSDDPEENSYGVQLIVALIGGDVEALEELLPAEYLFLSEIINNKYFQVDVDKWDYILRDAYYLRNNIAISEFEAFYDHARVLKSPDGANHISYNINDYRLVYNLFENRANLHIHIYQDSIIRGVEQMLIDAFYAAELDGFTFKGQKLSEAHLNLDAYQSLDDGIVRVIEIGTPDLDLNGGALEWIKRFNRAQFHHLIWSSPHPFDIRLLTSKFGPHFFQIQKKIPLALENMSKNLNFHDNDGNLVATPVIDPPLPRRGAFHEDYLIFSRNTQPEFLQCVSDFLHDLKD